MSPDKRCMLTVECIWPERSGAGDVLVSQRVFKAATILWRMVMDWQWRRTFTKIAHLSPL